MRDFLRHGSLVFAGLIGANFFTYLYYAAVSRAIGVEAAGLFTSLISAMLFLSLPGFVGATAIAKIVADSAGRGQSGVAVYFGRALAWTAGAATVTALLAATAGRGVMSVFFHSNDSWVISLAAVGFAFTLVLAPQRAVLQGSGRFAQLTLSNVLEGLGKAITGFVTIVAGGGLRIALGGYLASVLVASGYNLALTCRGARPQSPSFARTNALRRIGGIVLPIGATTAMTFVDVILVRHYLPAREAGLYGSAALVGRAMLTVIAFVPTVLLPKASARVALGESPVRLLFAALLATGLVVGAILAVIAIAPGLVVTTISGSAFAAAAPMMLPYGLAMAALAGALVLSNYLIGIDRHGFAIPLAAVALCEAIAIAVLHSNLATVLRIVVAGHSCAFLCCAIDTGFSLRPSAPIRTIAAET